MQLENIVAVALTRAYPDDVYYLKSAKTGIDIDFYVPSIGLAVQAAYSIAGDAREREVGNLKKLAQNSQEAARASSSPMAWPSSRCAASRTTSLR